MIPQLGISLLERYSLSGGSMLDPYCGSGSSFSAGIHQGFKSLSGNDLNPLATLISKVKFTKLVKSEFDQTLDLFTSKIQKMRPRKPKASELPEITNIDYWFSPAVIEMLASIKNAISLIENPDIRDLVTLAFSETIRDVSYTRNNEFKLYRIPADKIEQHQPDTKAIFLKHLERISSVYTDKYLPYLRGVRTNVTYGPFEPSKRKYDVVLTSPPYGDSRTTVAYGQFSTLTNEWLGISDARKIDGRLMGGKASKDLLSDCVLASQIAEIASVHEKRALEVSSFYVDLGDSIADVATSVQDGGYAIYIVGNRRVKDVQLQTDQFIAERFEAAGLVHVETFERLISSKVMPSVNSPSNKANVTRGTMTQEFIVVCKKP
jgi:hypothetical protein